VCGSHVVVVTGAHREAVEREIAALGVTNVCNPRWAEGLAASLRVGIEVLPAECAAALLLTCDQPRVPLASLEALAVRWRHDRERAIASAYAGTAGVPAIIPSRLFPGLRSLDGDRGARTLLHAEGERLEVVPVPEAALDVDDPAALAALLRD
jgi:molybdenum cofactor cytidylyltransferase